MELAGVSNCNLVYGIPFLYFLPGIVSAMVPIIGHHLGRGKEEVASDFINSSSFRTVFGLAWHGSILSTAWHLKSYRAKAQVAAVAVQ